MSIKTEMPHIASFLLLWLLSRPMPMHATSPNTEIPQARNFLVEGLDKVEPAFAAFNGSMYAGLLPVQEYPSIQEGVGEYMFWLFQPEAPAVDDSLVIWFNGGPGCSSFHAGLFMETGPVTSPLRPAGFLTAPNEADIPFSPNQYAWSGVTAILYVEQPVSVGFSHGGQLPKNETDIGRDFYGFLQNFMSVFSEQNEKRIFLVGESYAGYFVPSMAHYIYKQNEKLEKKSQKALNLKGIGVGNGWVDVQIQGPLVIEYAWWHGMIDTVARDAFRAEWDHCKKHIWDSRTTEDEEPAPFHRFTVPDECGIMGNVLRAAGADLLPRGTPNTYDVTTWDPYDVLNADDTPALRFFNNPKVQEILHVNPLGTKWMGCIPGAGRRRMSEQTSAATQEDTYSVYSQRRKLHLLDDDRPISTIPYVAELLDDAGIDVVVYNGDRDMSTCAQGSEVALNEMYWSGRADWLDQDLYDRGLWLVDGEMSGYAKQVENLQFVVVYNSGHLVPFNQPRVALDLVNRLVSSTSFLDRKIPVIFEPPKETTRISYRGEAVADSKESSVERIIIPLIAFAFGFATCVILSKLNILCFGAGGDRYDRIPNQTVAEQERLVGSKPL